MRWQSVSPLSPAGQAPLPLTYCVPAQMLIWSAQSYVTQHWLTLPLQVNNRCATPNTLATMHKQADSLHSLRLLLGTEAPIMTPNGADTPFLSSLHRTDLRSSCLHVLLHLHAVLFSSRLSIQCLLLCTSAMVQLPDLYRHPKPNIFTNAALLFR